MANANVIDRLTDRKTSGGAFTNNFYKVQPMLAEVF